jgi:hypothetical protein
MIPCQLQGISASIEVSVLLCGGRGSTKKSVTLTQPSIKQTDRQSGE